MIIHQRTMTLSFAYCIPQNSTVFQPDQMHPCHCWPSVSTIKPLLSAFASGSRSRPNACNPPCGICSIAAAPAKRRSYRPATAPRFTAASGRNGRQVVEWLGDYHKLRTVDLQPYLYRYTNQRAVRHILRVASGLDSLVLGEPQILGQIKAAYQVANSVGALGVRLERLFQHTFSVAKQVRTDTRIGASPVSVAFAAVGLARQIFADLPRCAALLIGAGDTIELVARHLARERVGRLIVANRIGTRPRAGGLFAGCAIALDEIPAHLGEADIVIASTASPIRCWGDVGPPVPETAPPSADVYGRFGRAARHRSGGRRTGRCLSIHGGRPQGESFRITCARAKAAAQQAEEIIDTQVEHFTVLATRPRQRRQHPPCADRPRPPATRRWTAPGASSSQGKTQPPFGMLAHTLTNKFLHVPCTGLRDAAEGDAAMLNLIKTLSIAWAMEDPADERLHARKSWSN